MVSATRDCGCGLVVSYGVEPHDWARQGIASTRRSFSGDHVKLLATSSATYKIARGLCAVGWWVRICRAHGRPCEVACNFWRHLQGEHSVVGCNDFRQSIPQRAMTTRRFVGATLCGRPENNPICTHKPIAHQPRQVSNPKPSPLRGRCQCPKGH